MQTYDYIVVGAGSAGCVIAGRLSEDPNCQVLLIEAGRDDRTTLVRKPGMIAVIHTVPQVKKKFDWGYYSKPRDWTVNRAIPQARGKVLGGSSAINGMVYVRGNRKNYDDWAAEGCDGWSFDEVLPYFKRLENFEGGGNEYRGAGGPIECTYSPNIRPVTQAFMEAVSGACGVPITDDYNGADQEGVGVLQMNAKDGLRYSTAEGYINPHLNKRPNLHVKLLGHVHRVVIESGRATGVVVADKKGRTETIGASKEVILSGGVIGSAQILMLSGIGPAEHLREHGIECIADLPVGKNLHDHLFFPLVYTAPSAINRGTPGYFAKGVMEEYVLGRRSWLSKSVFEALAFLKTDPSQPIPDLQVHTLPWSYPAPNQDAPVRPEVDPRPCITVQPTLIYPESRGELLLQSADPTVAPIYDPHYLELDADRQTLMRGIEMTREFMAHPAVAREITEEIEPGVNFRDKQALLRELPNRVCTVYHPVGTCRMGTDERAVVDPQLRVRGIEGLRVADAAIMPTITGGNTNVPSIMIGEKAADLIRGITSAR